MKTSNLGSRSTTARPAYNKLTAASKSQQNLSPSQRKMKKYRSLHGKSRLDYQAKGMNPALSNKMGKAVAGMITEFTARSNHTRP